MSIQLLLLLFLRFVFSLSRVHVLLSKLYIQEMRKMINKLHK